MDLPKVAAPVSERADLVLEVISLVFQAIFLVSDSASCRILTQEEKQ